MKEYEAFLLQARSDFRVFELLRDQDRTDIPECHPLHYLQMATEKLAKAALIARGHANPNTHVAFSVISHHICRRDVARALGWTNFARYEAFLVYAKPLFREIDELNPSVGPQISGSPPSEGPNVEYPWPTRPSHHADWQAPASHTFDLLERLRRQQNGIALLNFVHTLLDRFEDVFQ